MKKITIILTALLLTSCATTSEFTGGFKERVKNWGQNPCYDKATKTVKIGCKKK